MPFEIPSIESFEDPDVSKVVPQNEDGVLVFAMTMVDGSVQQIDTGINMKNTAFVQASLDEFARKYGKRFDYDLGSGK